MFFSLLISPHHLSFCSRTTDTNTVHQKQKACTASGSHRIIITVSKNKGGRYNKGHLILSSTHCRWPLFSLLDTWLLSLCVSTIWYTYSILEIFSNYSESFPMVGLHFPLSNSHPLILRMWAFLSYVSPSYIEDAHQAAYEETCLLYFSRFFDFTYVMLSRFFPILVTLLHNGVKIVHSPCKIWGPKCRISLHIHIRVSPHTLPQVSPFISYHWL